MRRVIVGVSAVLGLLLVSCTHQFEVLVSAEPTEGEAPLEVAFEARLEGDGSGADEVTYAWDFGDGNTSSEQNPTHTYVAPGDYRVELDVKTDLGNEDSGMEFVKVTGAAVDDAERGSESPTTAVVGDERAVDEIGLEHWVGTVNSACEATSAASAQVQGDPSSPESAAEYLRISEAESAAIEAAGVPTENTEKVQEFLAVHAAFSESLRDLLQNPPAIQDDPRITQADQLAADLDPIMADLGLDSCRAGS